MKNKIYLPKDKNKLFSIISSKEGLVLPLTYWGYPNMHITFYMKDMPRKKGFQKLNIHVTQEGEKEKIIEFNYEFDKSISNKKNKKLEEQFKKIFLEFLKKYSKKKPEESICLECFIKDTFEPSEKFNKKSEAKEFYKKIIGKKLGFDKEDLLKYKECNIKNHYLFYDLKKKGLFVRYPTGFVSYFNNQKLIKKIEPLLKENFLFFAKEFKNIVKKTKSKLKEFKR